MSVRFRQLVIYLLLAILTTVCYAQVTGCELFLLDDGLFVSHNPHVLTGLTPANIVWAFTTRHAGYWFPLTWLSLQADVSLFGPAQAWGFHLTNLLWHVVNVVLLFGFLQRLTGAFWRSAMVAALFAVHPQHVESVAWVTERKDVLSMFFGLLSLWSYALYAEKPSLKRYVLVGVFLALGLMSKPMLVTLPCVFLLLDFWPLARIRIVTSPKLGLVSGRAAEPLSRILLEKVPLLLLAVSSSLVVVRTIGSLYSLDEAPLGVRLTTAGAAYLGYLEKTFWPLRLGVYYPFPQGGAPVWLGVTAVIVLVGVTLLLWQHRPYLLVGWFWFLGTLVPVLGLLQAGHPVLMADRFTYLPHIGLFISVVWGIADGAAWRALRAPVQVALSLAVIACCSFLTWRQVTHWEDTFTLCTHTLEVTGDNAMMHELLGVTYIRQQDPQRAEKHFKEALRIQPYNYAANLGYAQILASRGQDLLFREPANPDGMKDLKEAIERYRYVATGTAAQDEKSRAQYYLGLHLIHVGEGEEGKKFLREYLKNPMENAEMEYFAGVACLELGERDEAVAHWRKTLQVNPYYSEANYQVGRLLLGQGKTQEALDYLSQAALGRQHAGLGFAHELRGLALGRLGRWPEAIAAFEQAIRLDPGLSAARADLAYAYTHEGRAELAAAKYQEVLKASPGWPRQAADAACQRLDQGKDRDVPRALELATEACQATGFRDPACLYALALANAAGGRLADALRSANQALALGPEPNLAQKLRNSIQDWQRTMTSQSQ